MQDALRWLKQNPGARPGFSYIRETLGTRVLNSLIWLILLCGSAAWTPRNVISGFIGCEAQWRGKRVTQQPHSRLMK